MNSGNAEPSFTSERKKELIKITNVNKREGFSDKRAGFKHQAARFSFNYACVSLAVRLPFVRPPQQGLSLGALSYAEGVFLGLPENTEPGLIPALAALANRTRHNEGH